MFRVLVMAAVGLFAPSALAEGDVDAVIKGVEAAYKDVQSSGRTSCRSRGRRRWGTRHVSAAGRLKRPKKMQWVFTQPSGQEFVTNGETMWVWSAADNQVIVSKGCRWWLRHVATAG